MYRLYKRGKIKNKISKILVKYKAKILALISWDITGPFPVSLRGNKYLLKLINNYCWKIIIIICLLTCYLDPIGFTSTISYVMRVKLHPEP